MPTSPRNRIPTEGPIRLDRSNCRSIAELFDSGNALELEIGAGKGKFLLYRAEILPDVNFIGIDYVWKYLKIGWQRAQKRELENLRFFKAEAIEVVRHLTPATSVSIFHIYFPDPWHKRKHHKRRYLTAEFVRLLHDRLVPGGLLELATDNFDYYMWLQAMLIEAGEDLWSRRREQKNERILNPEMKTNFELKYEAEGRELYFLELAK
jgi:tRNA (guanine-N7-)-methyltransferase